MELQVLHYIRREFPGLHLLLSLVRSYETTGKACLPKAKSKPGPRVVVGARLDPGAYRGPERAEAVAPQSRPAPRARKREVDAVPDATSAWPSRAADTTSPE
jgi:hypothetical protein